MQYITWLLTAIFSTIALFGWESPPQISLKGVLKTATRQRLTRYPDGTQKEWEEKSTILVPDEPIILSRSLAIGIRPPLVQKESPEFVHLVLSEEFDSLIGKVVELQGHFIEPSQNFFFINDIQFHVTTAIEIEMQEKPRQTVFYEPKLTQLQGTIYQKIYPGPPEYSSVENGDVPRKAQILSLTEPVDVELAVLEDEPFNQPEKGVREIQLIFMNSEPPESLWNKDITVSGTLFSAHTAYHHRRVLMMANHWECTKAEFK